LRDEREAAVALGIEIAARRETHLIGSDGPQSVEVCELFAEPPHRLGLTQTASATLGGLARKRVLRLGSRDGPAQLRLRDSVLADPLDLGQNFSLGTREVRGLELRGDGDDAAGLERGIVAANRVDQRDDLDCPRIETSKSTAGVSAWSSFGPSHPTPRYASAPGR